MKHILKSGKEALLPSSARKNKSFASVFRSLYVGSKIFAEKIIYGLMGASLFSHTVTLASGLTAKAEYAASGDSLELQIIRKIIQPGEVCFDVGANIGLYALSMSVAVGGQGRVHAFEPVPNTFRILSENIRTNNVQNVVLRETAVGDKLGKAEFFVTFQSGLAGLGNTCRGTVLEKKEVDITTLDAYVEKNAIPKVALIKIDVEGFEGEVLKGAEKLLGKMQSLVVIAELDKFNYESLNRDRWQIVSWMKERGYGAWSIDRKSKKIVKIDDQNKEGVVNVLFARTLPDKLSI